MPLRGSASSVDPASGSYSPVFTLRQELAAALEHASDERDALLADAGAAAELRRRLAQATAERNALSEQNMQLQREEQQLSVAGDMTPDAEAL
jgi:hypothetical protein